MSFVCVSDCHGMFADFAESFSLSSAQRELFEPLSRYEQICRDNVDMLKRLVSRSVPTHYWSVDVLLSACSNGVNTVSLSDVVA